MDIFEYRASRAVNTDGVFEVFSNSDNDLSGLFMRLKNLLISEIHTQWDIAFLETYIKNTMVPRSLRWEVCPQKGEDQLEEWYKYFNEAGVNFLRFLVKRKGAKLTRLDEEVKKVKEKLAPSMNSEDYKSSSSGLLKSLEKEEKEQKLKKRKKYNRDLQDYQSNLVFEWQKKLVPITIDGISEMEVSDGEQVQGVQGSSKAPLGARPKEPVKTNQGRRNSYRGPGPKQGPSRGRNGPVQHNPNQSVPSQGPPGVKPPYTRPQRGNPHPYSHPNRQYEQGYEFQSYPNSGYGRNDGPPRRPNEGPYYPQGPYGPNRGPRRNYSPQYDHRGYDCYPDQYWPETPRYNDDPYQNYKSSYDQDDPEDLEQQFNVPVKNQFFPLRDNASPRLPGSSAGASDGSHYREQAIDGGNPPLQNSQNYPGWGFPRGNQGRKRPVESVEAQGEVDTSSLKRSKT